jgi:hypothetical protein
LAIVTEDLDLYPEIVTLADARQWTVHRDFAAVTIDAGGDAGVAELAGLLRGVLDDERFAFLRAAWLDRHRPIGTQVAALMQARPLAELVNGPPPAGAA